MIEMLIKDQDTHISDILKHVMGNSTEELQSTHRNIESACLGTTDSNSSENVFTGTYLPSATVNSINDNTSMPRRLESVSSPKLLSSTNVWKQRAAIRELQKSLLLLAIF